MTDCSDLKAQIRKLQYYLDSTHAGTWEWNVQTGELNINERWAEIVGFERADLSPVHIDIWTWLAHPDDLERSNQALQDHFNGKSEHYDLDVRIRHKNGNWIWVHDRGQVTEWTEEGQPLWMHGTHEDVSYRVKIEHQLQALLSEERAARIQISEALKDQTDLANLLFNQPLAGVFIMMLDEPIEWHDGIDREKTLDYVFDHQRIIRVNKAMLTQYLASEDEFAGATPNQLFAHDLAQGREAWRQMFDQGHIHFETHELRFDGSEMDVIGDYICMYDSQGRITGHFGIQTDVTEQKIAERKARAFQEDLDETAEKYRLIAETTHDIVFVFNVATMTFSFISGSVETMLGYSVEEAMNLHYDQLFTQDSLRQMEQFQGHVLESFRLDPGNPVQKSFEIQHVHKDGHPVWVEVSITYRMDPRHGIEIVGASRDIDERKRRQEQILYAATHDPLTGLLNRTAVQTLSKTTIPGLDQEPSLTALLINVDKFRSVNETIGHHGGDQVIIDLSKIILSCAGSKNQVFRYSGDEFLVLTRDTDKDSIHKLARSIQAAVTGQFKYNQYNIQVTVSIGICLDHPEFDLDQTILNADAALFMAKKVRNSVAFFNESMTRAKTRADLLEAELSKALDLNQLELYYQPILDVHLNTINHAEALLRWNHPEFGQISPGEFIPLAEKTRLIIPMTDWVIREACRQLAEWRRSGLHDLVISVNLSAVTLEYRSRELVSLILETLDRHQVNPSSLILEITETALVSDIEDVAALFGKLKRHGVKLALDDFGTGYASFGALNGLPLDVIKIDRSLIRHLESNDRERMILDSLFTIIHGLDLEVVVEGVETRAQYDWLCRHGCDYIQGFLLSRPVPVPVFLTMIEESVPAINPSVAVPGEQTAAQLQLRSRS